jgi:tetratricopeptide (TPR) repeat protein
MVMITSRNCWKNIRIFDNYRFDFNNWDIGLEMTEDLRQAEQIYRQIIAKQPQRADAYNNLGNVLAAGGNLEEAIAQYQRAIALNPNYTQAYNNLGNVLLAQGNLEDAIAQYQQAVILNPNYIEAHYNLANALLAQNQLDAAKIHYQQAILLKQDFAEAYNNLGCVLQEEGNLEEAIAQYQQAINLKQNYAEAYNNLGNAWEEKGDLEEAIASYQQAIKLNPKYSEAYNNLGNVFLALDKIEEAIAYYQQALSFNPNYAQAYYNLGNALKLQGQLKQAIAFLNQALVWKPDFPKARQALGIALLLAGELKNGFTEYEWRYQNKEYTGGAWDYPLWYGEELQGKKILLLCDQGFGDAIQFIRYAPLIAQRGGYVIVGCYPELLRLFNTVPGIEELVTTGTTVEFDIHAPLMSLPYLLGTTSETIPAQIPYLSPPQPSPFILAAPTGTLLKIGIVWAGNPGNRNDRNRSCELRHFLPLLELPNIAFYSLQKGLAAKELAELETVEKVEDLSEILGDFADTAAAIAQLDLVITVDTSVAHLAGAMGKPVWIVLSFVPDWRWMMEREDSPWTGVFEKVTIALKNWVSQVQKNLPNNSIQNILPQDSLNLLKKCRYGTFLYNPNNSRIGKSIDLYGEYNQKEIELLQPIIQPNDLIVEIGANIGIHTVFLAKTVGKSGTILAFEPQRLIYQNLCANLALNSITNTYTYNVAIAEQIGSIQMQTEVVQSITLDSLNIPYCRLIKINVENMKLEILQGAINIITQLKPILYLKNNHQQHADAIINYIRSLNYTIHKHKFPTYNLKNFSHNPENIFGQTTSINYLCLANNYSLNLTEIDLIETI